MFRWENFTTANGLPDNHVFCVLVDGNRIWAGTENGLAFTKTANGKFFVPTTMRDNRASRIGPFSLSRSISVPAICGPEPWAG